MWLSPVCCPWACVMSCARRLSGHFPPKGTWWDICSPRKHGRRLPWQLLSRARLREHVLWFSRSLNACVCSSSSRRFLTAGMALRWGWGWKASTRCIRPCSVCCPWPRSESLSSLLLLAVLLSLSTQRLVCAMHYKGTHMYIVMHYSIALIIVTRVNMHWLFVVV